MGVNVSVCYPSLPGHEKESSFPYSANSNCSRIALIPAWAHA